MAAQSSGEWYVERAVLRRTEVELRLIGVFESGVLIFESGVLEDTYFRLSSFFSVGVSFVSVADG